MAWFKCIGGGSSEIANILKGTSEPISELGENGQIYLQYGINNKYKQSQTLGGYIVKDYLVSNAGQILCTIGGRGYNKSNNGDAIAVVWKHQDFSGPLLISTVPTNVYYSYNEAETYGSATIDGITWYISSNGFWNNPVQTNEVPIFEASYLLDSSNIQTVIEDILEASGFIVAPSTTIVKDAFARVNGTWQDLIGTEISEINAGGEPQPQPVNIKLDLIPRMTSDTTPKGECSASYLYSGRRAFSGYSTEGNGNIGHGDEFWYVRNGVVGDYTQYHFEDTVRISSVALGTCNYDYSSKQIKVQTSMDGTLWEDDITITPPADGSWQEYELTKTKICNYIRFTLLNEGEYVISGIHAYYLKPFGNATYKTGSFVSATSQYGIVDVYCGFEPDLLMVKLPFTGGDTISYWEKGLSYAQNSAIWCVKPAEDVAYEVALGRVDGETGIQAINNDGFSFMSSGGNTQGITCEYIAIKYEAELQPEEDRTYLFKDGEWKNQDILSLYGYKTSIENGSLKCTGTHAGVVVDDVSGLGSGVTQYSVYLKVRAGNADNYPLQTGRNVPTQNLYDIIHYGTDRYSYNTDYISNGTNYLFVLIALSKTDGIFLGAENYTDDTTYYYIDEIWLEGASSTVIVHS